MKRTPSRGDFTVKSSSAAPEKAARSLTISTDKPPVRDMHAHQAGTPKGKKGGKGISP